jgi:hypothetical protein
MWGRALWVLALAISIAVPLFTLPRLPEVTVWPALAGLVAWTAGKYVLCPLRWHGLSDSGRPRRWHLATYAESELVGMLTPGHVGADIWRIRRLSGLGMTRGGAAAEVALDRTVGAVGLTVFVAAAGATLPIRLILVAAGLAGLLVAAVFAARRWRRHWIPRRQWPTPGRLMRGLALSVGYQATIVAMLFTTVLATGYAASPLEILAAVGASQIAGAVPGPHGASPRDGALVVALVALGVPWVAALGAVTLKAVLAWAPAVLLGGGCLLLARMRDLGPGRQHPAG